MKDRIDAILKRSQAEYLESLLPPRDALFTEMEAYSAEHHVPSSDPEVALFLEITARAIAVDRGRAGRADAPRQIADGRNPPPSRGSCPAAPSIATSSGSALRKNAAHPRGTLPA